jgi:lysophospholipid acyltransferase (LPLAT)-like uncharacterized protein
MGEPSHPLEDLGAEQREESAAAQHVNVKSVRTFSRWQRLQIFLATWLGYFAVLFIGRSLRWEVFGWENYEAARKLGKSLVFTFWHCEIFPAICFWRKRDILVMVSQNFDGEYIARIIRKHGYGVARGSSSRSASRVLVEMIRELRKRREVAVTPDGPRGPRHVAKPGFVLLSKATGAAILCFHIVSQRDWVLTKSWDRTEIPQPFTEAALFIAPPIVVPGDADEEEQERKQREVQEVLDGLVLQGDEWLTGTGKTKSKVKSQRSKVKS